MAIQFTFEPRMKAFALLSKASSGACPKSYPSPKVSRAHKHENLDKKLVHRVRKFEYESESESE